MKRSEIHNETFNRDINELCNNNTLVASLQSRYKELVFIADLASRGARNGRYFPKYRDSNNPVRETDELIENLPLYLSKLDITKRDEDIIEHEDKHFVYQTLFGFKYTIECISEASQTSYTIYNATSSEESEEFSKTIGNKGTRLLFHCTSLNNLYSILKTGLRSMSNTELMSAGAAHGAGIYMSDSLQFASSYSTSDIKCALCFEVDQDTPPSFSNIFVLKKRDYRLKCILLGEDFSGINDENILKVLSKKYLRKEKAVSTNDSFMKRFAKELKLLQGSGVEDLNIRDIRYDNDITKPITLRFTPFNKDSKLVKQLSQNNIDGILIEIRIPDKWPYSPPYIRVVNPIFKYLTGHVTSGGSFCTEMLTSTGWTPLYTLLAMIRTLSLELTDTDMGSNAEIDLSRRNHSYTYEESLASYRRVATDHNWKIDI